MILWSVSIVLCAAVAAGGAAHAHTAKVLFLDDTLGDSSTAFAARLKDGIASAFQIDCVSALGLAARLEAEKGPGTILVLPNAPFFPAEAKSALEAFLRRGNHLMAVSGPAFANLVVRYKDEWLTAAQASAHLATVRGTSIVDFAQEDSGRWCRYSASMKNKTTYTVEPSGAPQVPDAMHVRIGRLDDWDVVASPSLTTPFPPGHTVTAFWAKGGPGTPELVVEWREKDGCRWMAAVKLTTEWKRYALVPGDFRYWSDNPSLGRGAPDDRFRPENADVISFGIASGISVQEIGVAHEFWVSDVQAAVDEFAAVDFSPPVLESISPPYKTYRTQVQMFRSADSELWAPQPVEVVCPIPRNPGFGFDGPRSYRWIPLARVFDSDDRSRGAALHLLVNAAGDYAGSVWGFAGGSQADMEMAAYQVMPAIVDTLKQMSRGVFLVNAGTQHLAYADGEQVRCGAYAVNLNQSPVTLTARFAVTSGDRIVQSCEASARVPARTTRTPAELRGVCWKFPPGEYAVRTTLYVGESPVDEITHEFRVVKFSSPTPSQTVAAAVDGGFLLAGKQWRAHGVNYWPRYSTGREGPDWVHWLSPEQYHPEIIEQDLALVRELGLNMLSVQYGRVEDARSMMDFLARAERHGIKVHVYLPGLHPLNPDFSLAHSLIAAAHLPQSAAVFAYDVGWEVHVGGYNVRKDYDKLWQDWVIDQYGSVQAAEKDWNYTPQRVNDVITGPTDDQLAKEGDWRVYVAAYRRFWDDEISKRYRQVRSKIRELDKVHLIGARSGYGGTGSMWAARVLPFDLASGAKHLDFTSPEGYALSGDRLGFLKGGIITLYGRMVSAGKPVFWAEYGTSIWPKCDAQTIEAQRSYYENMLNMLCKSDADGSAGWWWPGGFRLGENSDFGIVNPDGSPRPAALELRRFASSCGTDRQSKRPEAVITIDREEYCSGIAGILANHGEEYAKAVEAGKRPLLRTGGTGTDSANTPLVAVGNVPCHGSNPPKYLNAEFNYLKVNGHSAQDDAVIEVERGRPVFVEASVGNTSEATWLAPGAVGDGAVYLVATSEGYSARGPIAADTAFLKDATVRRFQLTPGVDTETTFKFRMTALNRCFFGEVRRVTLRPRS